MDARYRLRSIGLIASCLFTTFIAIELFLAPANAFAQYPRVARQPFNRNPTEPAARSFGQPGVHSSNGSYRSESEHFIVVAPDPQLAHRVATEAERYRKELAIAWLGTELGPWQDKCPIEVELGMHAGGETSFAFVTDETGRGRPISWRMKIFGPPDRLLDAVLPHEVTHTIFATHFGRPLPRWADEGACTTVEHESERNKNHHMLMDFLSAVPSRGIPFNRMFTMKDYPHDILPLYAQGYSLAKFLIAQKGRRYFLDFVATGMSQETNGNELQVWDSTTKKFYGYGNLSELQIAWLQWVRSGSQEIPGALVAANVAAPIPATAAVARSPERDSEIRLAAATEPVRGSADRADGDSDDSGWYARQSKFGVSKSVVSLQSLPNGSKDGKVIRANRQTVIDSSKAVPDDYSRNSYGTGTIWR